MFCFVCQVVNKVSFSHLLPNFYSTRLTTVSFNKVAGLVAKALSTQELLCAVALESKGSHRGLVTYTIQCPGEVGGKGWVTQLPSNYQTPPQPAPLVLLFQTGLCFSAPQFGGE